MTRTPLYLFTFSLLALCGGGLLFLKGCSEPKTTEIVRVTNPSGTIDAVVLSDFYDEGATGFHEDFRVLLVDRGKSAMDAENPMLCVDDAEGYEKAGDWRPEWKANDKLLFRFRHAHVTHYDNERILGDRLVGTRLEVTDYGGHEPEEGSPKVEH